MKNSLRLNVTLKLRFRHALMLELTFRTYLRLMSLVRLYTTAFLINLGFFVSLDALA